MYSLKVFLLLNGVRQGDLNSKWMSLNFLKILQPLCSSLSHSIPPPLIFPPSGEVCQFHLLNWKVCLSKVSGGKHTVIEVYAALIFCHIDSPPKLLYGFSFREAY